MSNTQPENVKVGQGATRASGTDCYPYTVVHVNSTGKTIKVQHDRCWPGPGHDFYGRQNWIIKPDAGGEVEVYTWRKALNGYLPKGVRSYRGAQPLRVGVRAHRLDPHF